MIRHAKAEHAAPSDAERSLTAEGVARFSLHVEGLARLDTRFDRVLYSPWRRAAETARLLEPLLSGEALACDALAREPDAELLDALQGTCVAVVGHEPWLTELVGLLVLGHREAGRAFELKKGGVVVLDGAPRPAGMRVRALLPPRVLRALR